MKKLADGYCARCEEDVATLGVEYDSGPERYDGVSEWQCPKCGRREGRWTGNVLTAETLEPKYGRERAQAIADEDYARTHTI